MQPKKKIKKRNKNVKIKKRKSSGKFNLPARCPATENIDRCHYRNFQAETTLYLNRMNLPPPPKKATMDWVSLSLKFKASPPHPLNHCHLRLYPSIRILTHFPSLQLVLLLISSFPLPFATFQSIFKIIVPLSSLFDRKNKASLSSWRFNWVLLCIRCKLRHLEKKKFLIYIFHTHQFIMVSHTHTLISRVIALWSSLSVG